MIKIATALKEFYLESETDLYTNSDFPCIVISSAVKAHPLVTVSQYQFYKRERLGKALQRMTSELLLKDE